MREWTERHILELIKKVGGGGGGGGKQYKLVQVLASMEYTTTTSFNVGLFKWDYAKSEFVDFRRKKIDFKFSDFDGPTKEFLYNGSRILDSSTEQMGAGYIYASNPFGSAGAGDIWVPVTIRYRYNFKNVGAPNMSGFVSGTYCPQTCVISSSGEQYFYICEIPYGNYPVPLTESKFDISNF